MNDLIEKENVQIEDMIYEIRGHYVILDRDLANLYRIETKVFMQSVKRNIKRFPDNFMFQLSKDEFTNWRSQFVTSKNDIIGLRRPPYAFTEYGVAMLSGILRSDIAININIKIINAFVLTRHYLISNKDIYMSLNNINNRLINHDNKLLEFDRKFNDIFSKFDNKEQLFLKGQTFSAYKNILEILYNANKEIIVIDEYADITFLDLIRNIKCNITLITRDSNRLSNIEIEKYNKEHNNLTVIRNNSFHDRFFVIDKSDIYLSGSSINTAGNKTFMIIKIEKESVKQTLLKDIDKIINK